ncbi:MAG TPA: ParA family partition ATPase [Thermoanaerobaculia bacterium]|nr:ParA family partition ATPase [Thermoanaerobaculia bacterium]
MKTLALFSQKGGTGKTTLAVHLAVAAGESGQRVAIADTDPQRSATTWGRAREGRPPLVATVTAGELHRVVAAALHDGIALLIVDSAPHATPDAPQIARSADAVLIPCRPSMFDLAAVGGAVEIVRAAGTPAALVLNECPSRAPEIAAARNALAGFGLPVAAVAIAERRAFSRAVATGRAVTEFEAHGKAAEEIRGLWSWIAAELLNQPRARARA